MFLSFLSGLSLGLYARAASNSSTTTSTTAVAPCPALPVVPEIASIAATLPTVGEIAKILPNDVDAKTLYDSIINNVTYAAALAIAPSTLKNGSLVMTGYNVSTDDRCWWSADQCDGPKPTYLHDDWNTCDEGGVWGLTVDDGPVPDHCALYQLWQRENIRASLFFIGTNVINNPAAAQEAYNQGHILCDHTWSHNYLTALTNEELFAELYYTKVAIKKVTGVTTQCWRPPYGDVDDRVRTFAHALELGPAFLWKWDTNDWQVAEPGGSVLAKASYDAILGNETTSPIGMMVLSHESTPTITALWIAHYEKIKATFKHVVSGHACLNLTQPYSEPDSPRYPNFVETISGTLPPTLTAVASADAKIFLKGNFDCTPDLAGASAQSQSKGSDNGPVVVYVDPNGKKSCSTRLEVKLAGLISMTILAALMA